MPGSKLPVESRSSSDPRLEPPKPTKHFLSVPQWLKPSHPTGISKTSIHRCLLISEIFCLILEFIRQYDDMLEEDQFREGCMVGKRTLASLARTCRAFSGPALDLLWMRLDSLDPLIKVLPSRIWAKKHSRLFIRIFMTDKHWLTFCRYAVRVQFLRGPCRDIPPSVQRNVITVLARLPGASLPLLPNLTELVWSESDTFSVIDPTVPLIKYFAGPRVTTVSLFLVSWPILLSAQAVLADLPNLSPNVTSFTAITRASLDDHSQDVGGIVSRWSNLRVLRSCALPQVIVDEIASRKTLDTLSIELNSFSTEAYVDKLPAVIHTFSLDGRNALHCIRYLQALQGAPMHFRLHVGLDHTLPADMVALFRVLPARFDTTRLQSLTIGSKWSYRHGPLLHSFPLTEHLLEAVYPFSALVALDLNAFCTSQLDDATYERMAATWPDLRSLKVGAEDVSRARPVATVGAVIAVLRCCSHLETLHFVFDGSISPPPPIMALDVDKGTEVAGGSKGCDWKRVEEKKEQMTTSMARTWGTSNRRITQIYVGHSPAPSVEDVDRLKELASCLTSVMPRLGRIQSGKEPFGMCDIFDVAESVGWQTVQRFLAEEDMNSI